MIEHIDNLRALRKALLEERRRLAQSAVDTAAANKEPLPKVAWCSDIKSIQEQLKALDEAISEEKKLADALAAAADTVASVIHAPVHPDA